MDTNDTPAAAPEAPKARANATVSITHNHDGSIGIAVKGFEPLIFNPAKAAPENRRVAEFVGWKNRFVDAAAVSADTTTGKTDTSEKYAAIKALVEWYEHPETITWARKRDAGGAGARESSAAGLTIPAMLALGKAQDVDHANRLIDALAANRGVDRKAALKLLTESKDIAAWIVEERARRAAAKTDVGSDDLLEGL